MTQKDKELLLKDLCARLPYGVKCAYFNTKDEIKVGELLTVWCKEKRVFIDKLSIDYDGGDCIGVIPYLFPMSSMTDEQKEELLEITDAIKIDDIGLYYEEGDTLETYLSQIPYTFMCKIVTWCYRNHLDINNLIPLNLAIDATGLNIY